MMDFMVTSFAISGTYLFAGTGQGVYLSTNNGTTWTAAIDSGLTYTSVDDLAVSGANLFAATGYGGVYLSTNSGMTWTQVNAGLTNTFCNTISVSDSSIFVGTNGGVFLSTNNGTSWSQINNGITNTTVLSLAIYGANLFAGTWDDIFLSTNNGTSWNSIGLTGYNVNYLAVNDSKLFVATNGGVFLSTNNGTGWTQVNTGLTNTDIRSLAVIGEFLYAGTWGDGIWRRALSQMITSAEPFPIIMPMHFSLEQNFPNPFNPATTFTFTLPSHSFVSLKVFDIVGKEVATVVSEEMLSGTYSRQWNASALSSGVYFYRLQAGSNSVTKKLVLLK